MYKKDLEKVVDLLLSSPKVDLNKVKKISKKLIYSMDFGETIATVKYSIN